MSTPLKPGFSTSQVSPNGSDIMTPFKGRAMEENRRRQALRMSVTPGLKRRLQIQKSHSSWRSNPTELRSFINDMSESRYQNGKNLMGELSLAAKDTTGEEGQPLPPPSSSIPNESAIEPSYSAVEESIPTEAQQTNENVETQDNNNNVSPSRPPKRLSDLIFSQLKTVSREVKIRKLEPLEIRDVRLKPLVEHNANDNNNNNNDGLNPPQPLIPNGNVDIVSNLGTGFPHTPPTLQPIYTQDAQQFNSFPPNDDNMDIDMGMDMGIDMEPVEEPRSFSVDQLSQSLDTHEEMDRLDEDNNMDIVTKIRHLLINRDGTFEKDFDKIITFLNNNNLILSDSMPSVNDIYEICCQYLDMSEINDIERIWFN
ncbi:hypothetical protein MOUN0_D05776 [Monosporozyma unispora]|nr:hypothetical protein C6P44_003083 [Kazachstania unispora]